MLLGKCDDHVACLKDWWRRSTIFRWTNAIVWFVIARKGFSSLFVITHKPETSWKCWDWIRVYEESSALSVCIEPISPLGVSNSGSSPGCELDTLKDSAGLDIDKAELSKSSTQTDSSDDEGVSVVYFSESFDRLISDGIPHILIFFLHLAAVTCVVVLNLKLK